MDIQLKDAAQGPVYAQVREQIETHIRGNQIATGETLPSPATLARQLNVDRGEIQRAYFELEHSGLIKKESGKDFLGQPKTTYRVA
ncbi:MAG TPA: GntR family transcriptional regulator [Pyrinomonadaceae bacterium]|nr:GntR family transcriptional regulator [Pyrinomonadaceae bacterium]